METHLSETFSLGMLLETEGWEMNTGPEDTGFCQNTDTSHTIKLHLHIRIPVRVTQICEVRPPRCILGITLHNDCILVQSFSKSQRGFGLLPGVQIVRLFST